MNVSRTPQHQFWVRRTKRRGNGGTYDRRSRARRGEDCVEGSRMIEIERENSNGNNDNLVWEGARVECRMHIVTRPYINNAGVSARWWSCRRTYILYMCYTHTVHIIYSLYMVCMYIFLYTYLPAPKRAAVKT